MGLVPWARSAAAPCSGSGPTSTQLRKLSRPAISPGEVGGPGAQAEVGMALVHLWAWGAARLPLGAVSPLRDRALRSARRAAHSPPLPGLPALAVSTPPGLVYGRPWVWLGLSGREQPPPDALTGPSPPASRAGPALQSWLPSACPHVVLSRVVMAARQEGSVLCPQPTGDARGACSTGLQGCGSAPSPSPASETSLNGCLGPAGRGEGRPGAHSLALSAFVGVAGLPCTDEAPAL